jgi:predicted anti-sigma-YlaC factor YlaD
MDCRDANELLSAFLDGETTVEESRNVEEHLAACAECRAAQRRMLALNVMVARSETPVSPGFRDSLFSRMEAEDLLPRRRNLFSYSFRWALPLAAAAALGLFLLLSRETPRGPVSPGHAPQVAATPAETPKTVAQSPGTAVAVREELTAEDREIVANLEVLEDPSSFEESGGVDEMEIFLPPARGQG